MKKTVINWSGGKDSALMLNRIIDEGIYKPECLLTTVNSENNRISMHGVPVELLKQQAESTGLPLVIIEIPGTVSMDQYNSIMQNELDKIRQIGIEYSAFGDIHLEDLRDYKEDQTLKAGFKPIFPLWKEDTSKLMHEFIDTGLKAVIVSTNAKYLGKEFPGRIFDRDLLASLPENVDPAGENGEFHTFVYDSPDFSAPINYQIGETILKDYSNDDDTEKPYDTKFWYLDLMHNRT